MEASQLLEAATAFYLDSPDFNGYSCNGTVSEEKVSDDELRLILRELVEEGKGALVFGDRHPNPHIRAFPDEPKEDQLEKLEKKPLNDVCLYPTANYLKNVVDKSSYEGRPYTLELALGSAQFEFRAFDLSVLEMYLNDPRYYYINDDINGRICIKDEYYLSHEFPEKDKVLLKTFGFAYDKDFNRSVAAFLIYLSRLSPEHQQIWKAKELVGSYKLHPDYFKITIGDWDIGLSIFAAFVKELRIINQMCDIMNRPHLFKQDFHDNRPQNFSFLIRPTLEEYNSFVLTLDKIMSENINKEFFMDDVSDTVEKQRSSKTIVEPKGTITMLEEWLDKKFRPFDRRLVEEPIKTFRDVRKQRQKPAHSIKSNVFNQSYFRRQRELVIAAYKAVRNIRLILMTHPAVLTTPVDIPDVLNKGKIWIY